MKCRERPRFEKSIASLASPEGQAAVNDVPNFATGGATFLYDDEEVIIPVAMT